MASSYGDDAGRLRDEARRVVSTGRDSAVSLAREARERASDLLGDRVDRWRGQVEEAADHAGENLENARVYVVERVQERPLAATLAALGVGFLLGALLAGSRR